MEAAKEKVKTDNIFITICHALQMIKLPKNYIEAFQDYFFDKCFEEDEQHYQTGPEINERFKKGRIVQILR